MGSVAGIQTRVQSGGWMADEAIERAYGTNLLPGPTNVKLPIESGNNGDLQEGSRPGQRPGRKEDGIGKIED